MAEDISRNSNVGPDEDRLMGALAYLGILVLIPLLTKKDSEFVKFHVKQGLVLFIAAVILWWIPFIGWFLLGPIVFVLMIIGLVMAAMGRKWKIPVVYSIAEKINL